MTEQRIRELMAAREAAMIARDAKALTAQYAPEAVAFTLAPPLVHHGEDVPAREAWFASFDGPIEYETRDLQVVAGVDVAYCHALTRLSTTPKGMPRKFELWFRSTLCLRKEEGDWRITHVHDSTPFHMDGTFRAAVDLRP